jgi:hypothetical protein
MAIWLAPAIVGLLLFGVVIYAIVRMSRGDEELEAGGSFGEQLGEKKSDGES